MKRVLEHPVLPPAATDEDIPFTFDGKPLRARSGEMLASALFAQGIQTFSLHRVGDAPQGIFCANGQCAQCTVIADGRPVKSCITAVTPGMQVRTLRHLPELPLDETPLDAKPVPELSCEVLVIGGGPSGITAAIELGKQGFEVLLVDDKPELGGKLVLQTHKFFGSIEDCHAGTRGYALAKLLEAELEAIPTVRVLRNSTIAALYSDRRAGIFEDNRRYTLIDFHGLVVSAGARERSLVFSGNDLPGVYGAGAFQTLVNRDRIRASERVFVVGSGNVGLIAAYHALQAGITVVGIIDILPKVSGYKVHADKIKRMGVPIYLGHTVIAAEGEGRVERVTIAEVDERKNPLLDTARTFAVDTVLVAVGLAPVDELYDTAREFGFPVVKAGDAEEIAEASSAMIGGRIAGLELARKLGRDVETDPALLAKVEILKSRPGALHPRPEVVLGDTYSPVFHCYEEIPCNPCTSVCKQGSIKLHPRRNTMLDLPELVGECAGCGLCVGICPGLAITLARRIGPDKAEVMLAHEFLCAKTKGQLVALVDDEGVFLEEGRIVKVTMVKKYRTSLITVETSVKHATAVAGIRIQDPAVTQPLATAQFSYLPDNGILCRCERVTVGELKTFIRENQVRDVNALKILRVGMGACGGKTCSTLLPRVFAEAGVDWKTVCQGTRRPLTVELPMWAVVNEEGRTS